MIFLFCDPTYLHINDISHLPKMTLDKMKYFFMHYKDLENKKVCVGEFNDWSYGLKIHMTSMILDVWYAMPKGIIPHT